MSKKPASTAARLVLTKGEFARRINVTPGRVSQYLRDGQIKADALVGEGRMAKIDVALAEAHLRDSLDISQRLGNGLETKLGGSSEYPAAPIVPTPSAPQVVQQDRYEDQIKQEKLLKIQRENRREAEQDAQRAGHLVLASQARSEADRIATRMMQTFDGAITDLAAAVSTQFKLPHRDVVHCMRLAFSDVRARVSDDASAEAESLPAVVETVVVQDAALQ